MDRYFGAHVSASGGLHKALNIGEELGINTIQVHPSPPQRWNSKPFPPDYESEYLERIENSCVEKVFFHGIYLINLANPDPQKQHLSKLSLVHDLDLSARINGAGVIFHVGSLLNEPDELKGYRRVAEAINWVLENSSKESKLILEVAAGSGNVIGDKMEELATIYEYVVCKERVGFGLDSQHMWASGYDLQNDLEQIVQSIGKIFSFEKVWAVHLNDSKTALASRKDRHENIGDGLIGLEALKSLYNHPNLRDIPFVLETPAIKEIDGARSEIKKVRELF